MRALRSVGIVVCMVFGAAGLAASGSVGETLLDSQRNRGQAVGNARAGAAVAVQVVAGRPSPGHVPADGARDGGTVVIDVDHVGPALATLLPRADIHRGHA